MPGHKSKSEPFSSRYTDDERKDLVARAKRGEITDDEAVALADDLYHAGAKVAVARTEMKNPGDPLFRAFVDPEARHASAIATVDVTLSTIRGLITRGAQKKAQWKEIQRMGVTTRQEKAGAPVCRRLAARYKAVNPRAKKPEICDYVFTRVWQPDYALDLTLTTIARLIAGYAKDAKQITRQAVASS